MLRIALFGCVLGIGVLVQSHAFAQRDTEAEEFHALRQAMEKLEAGQGRILKELEQIRGVLRGARQRPEPPKFEPTVVDLSGDPAKGKKNARVTLIDFTDYE